MPRFIQMDNNAAWSELGSGQLVVFLIDTRSEVVCGADGHAALSNELVPVFDNIEDARLYAHQVTSRLSRLCAQIYDHRGRAGDPLELIYHEDLRRKFDPQRRAKIDSIAGGTFLSAFVVWAAIGLTNDWRFFWFYVFGLKLFVIGSVLLVRGIAWFLSQRGAAK